MIPFGYYWELTHVASGEAVNSGFVRGECSCDWEAIAGYAYRFVPLFTQDKDRT